jgi:hypothetical protein
MIHPKVKTATATASVVSLLLALVTWLRDDPTTLAPLPKWLQGLVVLILPPLVTFLGGYLQPAEPPTPTEPPAPDVTGPGGVVL